MEILIIGRDEIKEYIRSNINTDNDKFLIPKEINADILERILNANKDFDYVVFSLEEVIDVSDIKKHLISFLKRYGAPEKFTIVDKNGRLSGNITQLSKMATMVSSFDAITGLPRKEFDIELELGGETEIDLSALDRMINGSSDDVPVREPKKVSAVQPEKPSFPAGNDILDDILNGSASPVMSSPVVDDDIMAILGGGPMVSPGANTQGQALPDIFGQDNANVLDDILKNNNPEMPELKPMGAPLQNPVPAQFAPSGGLSRPNFSENDIPDADGEKSQGGLRGLINNIIGPGKVGANQLPAIPQEVLPDNLKRPYIVTFWASKGGTGKTTVALNVCAYISSLTDLRVILIDVDEFGDTGLSMGMEKSSDKSLPTVDDFINHISSMKTFEDVLPFVLKELSTNLHILLTSENASNSQRPTKSDYQNVLRVLQQHFDIIAFDCGDKLYDGYTSLALAKADFIVMVVDQGFPTLSHMSQIISEFSQPESGIGRDKLIMVVNKYQKNVGMSIQDINTWFEAGVSNIHWIPAIFFDSMKSLNQGDLIILGQNIEIKQAYNRIVCDVLRKIKAHQAAIR